MLNYYLCKTNATVIEVMCWWCATILKLFSNSTLSTNCLIVYIDGGQNLSQTTFLVAPQQLKSKLGDNVHLPCPTTGTGNKKEKDKKSSMNLVTLVIIISLRNEV